MCRLCALVICVVAASPLMAFAADDINEQMKDLLEQVKQLSNTVTDLKGVVESQNSRIEALEKENEALRAQPQPEPQPQPGSGASAPDLATAAAATSPRPTGGFNPDISVGVDIVGAVSESNSDEEGNDRISVRELELSIGHDIDPYARFDSTITLSDFEDVAIEEAYVTFWELPGDIQLRLGRMRPRVGKESAIHRDQLDTVDMPLVIQRYLGVEGLYRTGAELSRLMPQFAAPLTQELVVGMMEGGVGEDGMMFGEERRHPMFYAHLKNAFDVSPETSLELGGTYLIGSSDEDTYDVNALGADLTLTHYFTPVRRMKWQSEMYAQWRNDSAANDTPIGFYSLLDMRLTERWGVGGRYDWVQLVDEDATEQAYSLYGTFFQSEFARWRLQYQLADLADAGYENRLFLQATFAVGAHKHRIQ